MLAAAELGVALIEGGLVDALDNARGVAAIATNSADPIAHTSLLGTYGYSLVVNGRYDEALECIDTLTRLAESNAIDFAVPYAQIHRAKALVGIRKFAPAGRTLSMLEREMQDEPRGFFQGNISIERARLYASLGDLHRALDVLSLGPPTRAPRTTRSEFLGWQALLTAAAGDSGQARVHAADACQAGRGLEAQALALLAEAIIDLREERPDESVARLGAVIEAGVCDPIVIAVRAVPDFGAFIAEQPQWRSWFQRLLAASRDVSLAASLGLRIPRAAKEVTNLSPREAEVLELLAQGLTNE